MHDLTNASLPRVNGQALCREGDTLPPATLRQRACAELLRQAAQARGLLDATDEACTDGAQSEAASRAIEALLDRELVIQDPDDNACKRYFEAHRARFAQGEFVRVRHILFAVTPGVDVRALRERAEAALLEVRCHDGAEDRFPARASEYSNCPSGAQGGDLGWLSTVDCAPEFAAELFGRNEIGVLPRLVHSRFGLHVVEVLERRPGQAPDFEDVRQPVRLALRQHAWSRALRQYLQLLAGAARVEGVELEGAETPLVQ